MKYYAPTKLSENIHETPEGFLVCLGVPIARTGVQIYAGSEIPRDQIEPGADGKIKINRSEEEVFRPQTIASFQGKALTIGHPKEYVGPDNWKDLAKGVLQNVRRGEGEFDDSLIADVLVKDIVAIGLVKNGLREVSCGYEAMYEEIGPGEGNQVNIVGNHLALVPKGRAGPAYAINDHQGKEPVMKKKFSEKIKDLFAKVADEAAKMDDVEDPKEKKADDAAPAASPAFDELKKMVADLGEKIAAMGPQAKDAVPAAVEKKVEEKKADDEGAEAPAAEASMEDRMKALEASVAKILEAMSEEAGDEDGEEVEDAEEEEVEDAAACGMVGDSAARAEILAPGIEASKDFKKKALMTAFGTKEGKEVIQSLSGGKVPTFDSAEKIDSLFIAASEVLKAKRSGGLAGTKNPKQRVSDSAEDGSTAPMTPEQMNAFNAKFYATK